MQTIELNKISGRITKIEAEVDEDDEISSTFKIKTEDDRIETAKVKGNAPLIIGDKVTITTQIVLEGGKRRSAGGGANVLFGKNGKILIDDKTGQPFPARTGPKGRETAAEGRLKKARNDNGGLPTPAQTRKFKEAFVLSGKTPEKYNDSI